MANILDAGLRPDTKPTAVPKKPEPSMRKLVVGSGITFSGEITSCDLLVVEGTVKANIAGCNEIQIAKGGVFIGSASVANAEVQGRFEGELNVTGRLLVNASGRVAAKVRYHQIQVELGGEISGDIQAGGAGSPHAPLPT
jgi:cytoskeletal protein CcmA (bactofilin family)